MINQVIVQKWEKGSFYPIPKRNSSLIKKLIGPGAQGIMPGYTEISILIKQEDCEVPVFDAARLNANASVQFALAEQIILARNYL